MPFWKKYVDRFEFQVILGGGRSGAASLAMPNWHGGCWAGALFEARLSATSEARVTSSSSFGSSSSHACQPSMEIVSAFKLSNEKCNVRLTAQISTISTAKRPRANGLSLVLNMLHALLEQRDNMRIIHPIEDFLPVAMRCDQVHLPQPAQMM